MKIVIDIPEEVKQAFDNAKNEDLYGNYYDYNSLIGKAIRNGTPLPKGHGRLVDADALEKDMVNGIKSGLYEEGYETFAHINDMDDCVECVKYAPTIIEADKAESEDKLDGDPIDIDKAIEHYEGTLKTLKAIDLEVDV